jgi:hypothetical protein
VLAPSVAAPDSAPAPASASTSASVLASPPIKRRRCRRRRARRVPPPTTSSPQPPPTQPFIRQPPLFYYSPEYIFALIPSFVKPDRHVFTFNWEEELRCYSSARLYSLPPSITRGSTFLPYRPLSLPPSPVPSPVPALCP